MNFIADFLKAVLAPSPSSMGANTPGFYPGMEGAMRSSQVGPTEQALFESQSRGPIDPVTRYPSPYMYGGPLTNPNAPVGPTNLPVDVGQVEEEDDQSIWELLGAQKGGQISGAELPAPPPPVQGMGLSELANLARAQQAPAMQPPPTPIHPYVRSLMGG